MNAKPAAQDQLKFVGASGARTAKVHRATCKRPAVAAEGQLVAAGTMSARQLRDADLATCCKPNDMVRAHAVQWLQQHGAFPSLTGTVEQGRGELAGGDVQPLPASTRPRTRKANRHDQRTPLPTIATTAGVVIAQQARITPADGEQTCTGACGQTLPLRKFPTIDSTRRGTECRACRDARRAAAKAAR